jgi:hypothetical protein
MWRNTKNWAGTQSSCSLTSSPMRFKTWPQAQWVSGISWWVLHAEQAGGQRLAHGLALGARL